MHPSLRRSPTHAGVEAGSDRFQRSERRLRADGCWLCLRGPQVSPCGVAKRRRGAQCAGTWARPRSSRAVGGRRAAGSHVRVFHEQLPAPISSLRIDAFLSGLGSRTGYDVFPSVGARHCRSRRAERQPAPIRSRRGCLTAFKKRVSRVGCVVKSTLLLTDDSSCRGQQQSAVSPRACGVRPEPVPATPSAGAADPAREGGRSC